LRLRPETESKNTALLAVPNFDALTQLFQTVSAGLGEHLTAFEVMWETCYHIIAVESERHSPPLSLGAPYYVIVEARGNNTGRDEEHFLNLLGKMMEEGIVSDATMAASQRQANAIWAIREDIEALVKVLFPAAVFDISLPIREMENYVSELRGALETQWGDAVRLCVFGHMGDSNLHIIISPRPWSEEARERIEKIVYEPLKLIGGAVSAEHGIGLEKRKWLHVSRSPEEITLMKMLKQTLDPKGLLNPEKIWSNPQ